jgi:hypothetical protein
MVNATRRETMDTLEIGDFISVPAWKTYGMVIGVDLAWYGSDDARRVLVQEHPDQRTADCKWFQLEPGEYVAE